MITRLQIEGMAIIDSLSIQFSSGFNVITGETGAGKSILIRALNFLSGARLKADAVRQGRQAATVSAEFRVPLHHPALNTLEELGIGWEAEGNQVPLLIRRTLTQKGRSAAWVNDVTVTNPTLCALGVSLLDIFAQHENQRLLEESRHLDYLDPFLDDRAVLREVERLSRSCWEKLGETHRLVSGLQESEKNRDFLEFRLKGLQEFGPEAEDFERVNFLAGEGSRMLKVQQSLGRAASVLGGDSDNAAAAIREALRCLEELDGKDTPDWSQGRLGEIVGRLEAAAAEIDDLNFELEKLAGSVDVDESDLEAAQERLFGYQDLFRRHGVRSVEDLLEERSRLEQELDLLDTGTLKLKALLKDLEEGSQKLGQAAARLSSARRQAAENVKSRVEEELQDLAMKGSRIAVEFTPVSRSLPDLALGHFDPDLSRRWGEVAERLSSVSDQGAERSRFLLSSNPGEPLLPLARIASGGELSRILLAFKKALAADADTCVLVFDEIDTGISGRVADVVGAKLRDLAGNFQVICISHLPQVAVYADRHFLVEKVRKGERTESTLTALSDDESAREIARLLSGAKVSDTSLAHAKTLMQKARGKGRRKTAAIESR